MGEPASKLTDRLLVERDAIPTDGTPLNPWLMRDLLREAASALEQAEGALAHYARLDHVTEPDEGFVARDALAVLEPDG